MKAPDFVFHISGIAEHKAIRVEVPQHLWDSQRLLRIGVVGYSRLVHTIKVSEVVIGAADIRVCDQALGSIYG
jgi:hypothetical protein